MDELANTHQCRCIARVATYSDDRDIWLGELLEPLPGYPSECFCLHLTTPRQSIVLFLDGHAGDALMFATLAQIMVGKPINPHMIERTEQRYRKLAYEGKL